MIKTARPTPMVIAAVVAFAVLLLTFFGLLEGIPDWGKGTLQFGGTVGGIVLGYLIQAGDSKAREEARAKSARGQVVALAETLNIAVDFVAERRLDLSVHTTLAPLRASADASLSGVDTALRGVLKQASAAANNWDHATAHEQHQAAADNSGGAPATSAGNQAHTTGAEKNDE